MYKAVQEMVQNNPFADPKKYRAQRDQRQYSFAWKATRYGLRKPCNVSPRGCPGAHVTMDDLGRDKARLRASPDLYNSKPYRNARSAGSEHRVSLAEKALVDQLSADIADEIHDPLHIYRL